MKQKISSIFIIAALAVIIAGGVLAYNLLRNRGSGGSSENSANAGAGAAQTAVYHKITPEEAKKIMDSEDPYILVDVRTESEYEGGHIKNAILIPNTEIANRAGAELPDKNALIFVYCRSGARSSAASNELVKMGYTNVYDLGGIMNWPYDVATD